jgi:hypothetical protein
MAITVKHSKVSTIPDDANTDLVRPSDWNADHTLVGLGTMAEQDANNVNITGGTITGVTGLGDVTGPASSTDNAIARFNGTTGKLIQNSAVIIDDSNNVTGVNTLTTTNLVVNDDATLGGSNADTVAVNGRITTDLEPNADAAKDIGTSGRNWRDGFFSRNLQAEGKVVSPHFDALNSAGGQLRNSGGTPQIQWGAGGGNNVSVDVAININPANAQVDISPTGTGTVRINPATTGTIDNTSIGATTPSTVNATTITGQTGVLRGTGQNLLLQSQTFTSASWTQNGVTPTGSAGTAPDGSNTATNIIPSAASTAFKELQQNITNVQGITYTFSGYFKQNGYQFIQLIGNAAPFGTFAVNYDLNSGTETFFDAGTSTVVARGITSVGNGWYRVFVAVTALSSNINTARISADIVPASNSIRGVTWSGNGTSGVLIWGFQIEVGSTANTYIPTTTTAVYGTPTLSFSGVSSIGLLSNGALYLEPAGTGAIQADATTSTAAGGNARGANAVDWQTSRGNAARVASGTFTVVSGGNANSATSYSAATSGGESNQATANYAFIGGGSANTASGVIATIVGGQSNTAAGYFNFIGGGSTNSGTALAAVTTQSGTMDGTTAVTLSGSNASIKVGQFITGTSIASNTYVAAISGTSLTLSQAASGSSTSTLSFFTPHGVVVGGGNNQATGSYSFIGGGGNAGTAGQRNTASGDWSFVGGGQANTASAIGAVVVGGGLSTNASANGNTASAICSFVGSGGSNTASGTYAFIGAGFGNAANAVGSAILGSYRGSTRSIQGNNVFPACVQPMASSQGVSQSAVLVLARETTDATPTALASNTSAAGTTNQVILPNNSAYFFRGEVISGKTAAGDTKGWTIEGVIKRGANAASTALVGIPTVTSTYADLGAATWDIAVTADTTNGGIRVTFTGQAATTIRTVCRINTVEMTF